MRKTLASIVMLLAAALPARATFIDTPSVYTPGETFDLVVALPDVDALANYSVDVSLTSAAGQAGVQFGFAGAVHAPQDYVFASSDDFQVAINQVSLGEERITLSDFEFSDTNVSAPGNRLAVVSIATEASHREDLVLSIDPSSLVLRSFGVPGPDVPGFDAIRDELAAASVTIPVIPEPGAAGLLAVLAMGWLTRRR